ncbi:hypothetical protein J6590_044376 [Homalodisca vitripennis]|nr:hypothetical protein J6590_044376 [Homalodisca vitripennis]
MFKTVLLCLFRIHLGITFIYNEFAELSWDVIKDNNERNCVMRRASIDAECTCAVQIFICCFQNQPSEKLNVIKGNKRQESDGAQRQWSVRQNSPDGELNTPRVWIEQLMKGMLSCGRFDLKKLVSARLPILPMCHGIRHSNLNHLEYHSSLKAINFFVSLLVLSVQNKAMSNNGSIHSFVITLHSNEKIKMGSNTTGRTILEILRVPSSYVTNYFWIPSDEHESRFQESSLENHQISDAAHKTKSSLTSYLGSDVITQQPIAIRRIQKAST